MSIKVTQAWDGVELSLEQGSGSCHQSLQGMNSILQTYRNRTTCETNFYHIKYFHFSFTTSVSSCFQEYARKAIPSGRAISIVARPAVETLLKRQQKRRIYIVSRKNIADTLAKNDIRTIFNEMQLQRK